MTTAGLRLWIDAQLPPALASWLHQELGIEATHVETLGYLRAPDRAIFAAARAEGVVIVAKDSDFVTLLERNGPPPQILWVTVGNTSTRRLREVFRKQWPLAAELLGDGEPLVELRDEG